MEPEGRYLLDFDTRDLPRFTTDVLVVGGGVAGLSAALAAASDRDVLVVMKDAPSDANTALAQGGIAAAVGESDSPKAHLADTLRTGCGLTDVEVAREVTGGAPAAIRGLVELGAAFDRENGGYALGREGGHGCRRIVHARGDCTGAECSRVLVEAVEKNARIRVLRPIFLVDFLTAQDRCVGILARRGNEELVAIFARAVVLAAGGAGRLFRETSNSRGATGDGIAAAYRAGAALRDLEFVQFHPTTLYLAGSNRVLVTEAVRGDGAKLIDNLGRRFLEGVLAEKELAPRDVVSRQIVDHLARPEVTGVFLDLRDWEAGHAAHRFPGLVRTCVHYGIDPELEPIPVRPAAHYFVGGVACDRDGRTNIEGLFACGEAGCSGLHGANRLASNSLLEGLVLGPRAGRAAARFAAEQGVGFTGDLQHAVGRAKRLRRVDLSDLRRALISRMWRSVGILRDAGGLEEAAMSLGRWRHFISRIPLFRRGAFELENMLLLGALVTAAAGAREESRGTHGRLDHPGPKDDTYLGSFWWRAGEPVEFRPAAGALHG